MSRTDDGRTGRVFSIRLTSEQIRNLKRLQKQEDGAPTALGPFIVQRAIEAPKNAKKRSGSTRAAQLRHADLGGRALPAFPSEKKKLIVLELGGAGGAWWSLPYKKAGHTVIKVDTAKLCTFVPPAHVYAVLARPPTPEEIAQNHKARSVEYDRAEYAAHVNACLRIIMQTQPKIWALESSRGFSQKLLGQPVMLYQPYHFGHGYERESLVWGQFQVPQHQKRVPITQTTTEYGSTPTGFARAFFEANP